MHLAKQGGLVTSNTTTTSLAQYSNANSELSATAPSHAATSLVPALASAGPALSPETGDDVSCHAWQDKLGQFGVGSCIADWCAARMLDAF